MIGAIGRRRHVPYSALPLDFGVRSSCGTAIIIGGTRFRRVGRFSGRSYLWCSGHVRLIVIDLRLLAVVRSALATLSSGLAGPALATASTAAPAAPATPAGPVAATVIGPVRISRIVNRRLLAGLVHSYALFEVVSGLRGPFGGVWQRLGIAAACFEGVALTPFATVASAASASSATPASASAIFIAVHAISIAALALRTFFFVVIGSVRLRYRTSQATALPLLPRRSPSPC